MRRRYLLLGGSAAAVAALAFRPAGSPAGAVTPPEFNIRTGPLNYARDGGGWRLLTDLRQFQPAAVGARVPGDLPFYMKAYFVSADGSDDNAGLSWDDALRSIWAATAKPDVDAVFVRGGDRFPYANGIQVYRGTRDIAIIAVGAPAIMNAQIELDWVDQGSGLYAAQSETAIVGIIQVSPETGGRARLDDAGKFGARDDLWEGSFAADRDGRIFLRTLDGAVPDNLSIWALGRRIPTFSGKKSRLHFYNFDFVGGFTARNSDINSVISVERCRFSHRVDGDGYQVLDVGLSIASNCQSFDNDKDGFNGHAFNGLDPHLIEVNCAGIGNLWPATGNGSTAHNKCVIFRLGGRYEWNGGPGVVDVDESLSFSVGLSTDGYSFLGSTRTWMEDCAGPAVFSAESTIELVGNRIA